MAFEELIVQLLETNNVILFIALIILFVVAYRVLQAVINTAIVAVLSAAFVVALDLLGVGPGASFNNIMLFAVLGTGFFIIYSGLATVIRASSTLMGALAIIGRFFVGMFSRDQEEEEDDPSKEKQIVLSKMEDD